MTNKQEMPAEYPVWVCNDCGNRYGNRKAGEGATWHYDKCDICKCAGTVTEPRDFGHLKDGWEKAIPTIASNITDSTLIAVLTCPFCGEQPTQFSSSIWRFSVACLACDIVKYDGTAKEAAEKWNTRLGVGGQP